MILWFVFVGEYRRFGVRCCLQISDYKTSNGSTQYMKDELEETENETSVA